MEARTGPIIVTGGQDLGERGDRNVILWSDHRAEEEALFINKTNSKVLKYVGGTMSVSCLCTVLIPKQSLNPNTY